MCPRHSLLWGDDEGVCPNISDFPGCRRYIRRYDTVQVQYNLLISLLRSPLSPISA